MPHWDDLLKLLSCPIKKETGDSGEGCFDAFTLSGYEGVGMVEVGGGSGGGSSLGNLPPPLLIKRL